MFAGMQARQDEMRMEELRTLGGSSMDETKLLQLEHASLCAACIKYRQDEIVAGHTSAAPHQSRALLVFVHICMNREHRHI